jgi:hypothetical protein
MSIKRFLCTVLSALMILALVPCAALADTVAYELHEAEQMRRWDDVWAALDPVEKAMMDAGANRNEVTMAVYKAALNCPLIDAGSITDVSDNEFAFTTNGMWGGYNYRVRNYDKAPARETVRADIVTPEVPEGLKNSAGSMNVLLVNPYYGSDSSFTDQYIREAQSIAQTTGGTYTALTGSAATGPAIAQNYTNKGVVIYDSHGNCISSKGTSYLDLTTGTGLTSADYTNGWAYNGGSFYGIDGRYIQNHASGQLSNCLVWMAICEGMKRQGNGTTGTALLAKGAAAVYGYSQSVTFAGDYEYEAIFWNEMKEGAPMNEALQTMKAAYGVPDPYGDAWPIVMSPVDAFPSNPDGEQTVNCDWSLFEPAVLESFTLSDESLDIYEGFTGVIDFEREPFNAGGYELTWSSEDTSIVLVSGNSRRATVTGVAEGATRIKCEVTVGGQLFGTAWCTVNVMHTPTLSEAANVPGGTLEFTSATASYPWRVGVVNGELCAMSGNSKVGNSTSTLRLVLDMEAGETLTFKWMASAEEDFDYFRFFVNNSQTAQLTGETDWVNYTYTAGTTRTYTFEWRFVKDPYVDGITDAGYLKEVEYSGAVVMGDVDGDHQVTSVDALLIMRYSLGIVSLSASELRAADLNGDGIVDSVDALIVLRLALN